MRDILEAILRKHDIKWCRDCESRGSHKRGFVKWADRKTIHLDSPVTQRRALYRALHEVGHCVNDERGLRRYEQEENANEFARKTMLEFGISVPREVILSGARYVARKKRHGDNIINSK